MRRATPGIVAGVLRGDAAPIVAAYGNPGPGAPPLDADSVFEIGSITKVFTTTLLLDMADQGLVKLDDPVGKYLPAGVRVPSRNGRQITLVDLATHTSGLPRLMTNLTPADPGNPYGSYTVEQLYAFLSGHELTRDIGAQYEVPRTSGWGCSDTRSRCVRARIMRRSSPRGCSVRSA